MSPREPLHYPEEAARQLAATLRQQLSGEVRFDNGNRALYATDGSNYRQVPIGVVLPKSDDDVINTIAACREHKAPLLARGGGTSLAGQGCNTAVVMDMSKYLNRILDIDPVRQLAWVEPGCVLDQLRDEAEKYHLTFGPDPATHDHNTLGGMLGNNSCGPHSIMAGRTADNVQELDIVTYDGLRLTVGPTSDEELHAIIRQGGRKGEIYAGLKAIRDRYADLIRRCYPHIPRRVSGYNLPQLLPENGFNVARALVGSEGTCVTILRAGLNLVHSPPVRMLVVFGYPDVYSAADHVPVILEHQPVALEGLDKRLIHYLQLKKLEKENREMLPDGEGWLYVEIGGETEDEAKDKADRLIQALQHCDPSPHSVLYADPDAQEMLWKIRESGLAATAHVPGQPDTWPGWEDAAVPPERVGDYLREFRALLNRYDYDCSLYGHFGDGCIHVRIDFDLTSQPGIDKYKAFTDEAAALVNRYNGSLSGEHGDGQARADLLPEMFGSELMQAMREFKAVWDPLDRMNPGKIIDPYGRDENLRLGADYREPALQVNFAYPEDQGNFSKATLRCVGVGVCRHINKGVMCPSYMATREEMHSTRGRARLLYEMVHSMTHDGDPLNEGWKSEAVHEALDLCLACKGCKKDCPVSVDMATYKAEFMNHYYQGRWRPRVAYSMGLIHRWSKLASALPGLTNFFTQTPGLSTLVKKAAGISPERQMPRYARQTFRSWFHKRGGGQVNGPPVLLFPDTFNNYLHPEVLIAAVEVLEAGGWQVSIPDRQTCCGRPLYAWGMLAQARDLLEDSLRLLTPAARRGVPVVGLEPACVAAYRDELPNLFPDDERAQAVAQQTQLLSEFLDGQDRYRVPSLHRKALVHAHCNHHAIIGFDTEQSLFDKMGLAYEKLDSGCCGMAGSFGFEEAHYRISLDIGERVLLPAVRAADPDTLIITDGYSCREQITQTTERTVLHSAEVLQMALRQ